MNKKSSIQHIKFLLIIISQLFASGVWAQARFLEAGSIEFEKKVNMHKWLEDNMFTRQMKDEMPTYRINYFNLQFDRTHSVYMQGREVQEDKWKNMWGVNGSTDDKVITDFGTNTASALKQIFESQFLIQDSLLKIEWRITEETRSIAGFECRKAVGKMYDSLYVVAFYTDLIKLPGGPEQYNGLPGMILGLAFPRYYTTWFATKVELTKPQQNAFVIPSTKSKKITRKELFTLAKDANQWGSPEERQKFFWNTVL